MSKPSVVVGVSSAEQGRYSKFYAHLAGMQRPDNYVMTFSSGAVISENRNAISQVALDRDAEWVLYLDDDHILCQDTLMRLLAAEKDVISALYVQRQPPFNPVLMSHELPDGTFIRKQLSTQDKGVISVAATGAGCLLVRTAVLKALTPPYWTLGQIHPASWGDDLHFCSRIRKAGFEIHCDLDTAIGHMMAGSVWPSWNDQHGWTANLFQDIAKGPIAAWMMPLPGDP